MRRGFTVLEMLVACVLTSLIVGIAAALLALSQQSWNQVSNRASLAINAEVAIERVRRDMQDSSAESLTSVPNAVGFATARDPELGIFQTDSEGNPAWQSYLTYYVDTGRVLRERQTALPPRLPLSSPELQALCDGSGHGVAYGVSEFSAELSGPQMTLNVSCQALGLQTIYPLRNGRSGP